MNATTGNLQSSEEQISVYFDVLNFYSYTNVLFYLLYFIITLLWMPTSICLIRRSKLSLSRLQRVNPYLLTEYETHYMFVYKERLARSWLFLLFVVIELLFFTVEFSYYILLYFIHDQDNGSVATVNISSTCQVDKYFQYAIPFWKNKGAASFIRKLFSISLEPLFFLVLAMFSIVLSYLIMAVNKQIIAKPHIRSFFIYLAVALIFSVLLSFPLLYFFAAILLAILFVVVYIQIIQKTKHFLRLLRNELSQLIEEYSPKSPVLKEKKWLLKLYRVVLYGHIIAFGIRLASLLLLLFPIQLYNLLLFSPCWFFYYFHLKIFTHASPIPNSISKILVAFLISLFTTGYSTFMILLNLYVVVCFMIKRRYTKPIWRYHVTDIGNGYAKLLKLEKK